MILINEKKYTQKFWFFCVFPFFQPFFHSLSNCSDFCSFNTVMRVGVSSQSKCLDWVEYRCTLCFNHSLRARVLCAAEFLIPSILDYATWFYPFCLLKIFLNNGSSLIAFGIIIPDEELCHTQNIFCFQIFLEQICVCN